MNRVKISFAVVVCALVAAGGALGSTNVGGPILTDTTWNLAGSPYIVTSSIIVGNGATLTIQPGVEVRLNEGMGLIVGYASFPPTGNLVARGSAGSPVLFTSNTTQQPGAWVWIYFTDYAVDAVYDGQGNYLSGSILEYVTVEYAGFGDVAAVLVESSSPGLNHIRVHDSSGGGISVTGNAPSQRITNCEIAGISGSGVYIGAAGTTLTGNTITGNTSGGGVYVGGAGTTLTGNTITGNTAGYSAGGGVYVGGSNCTLTGNTITGNAAGNYAGGAVYVVDSNCTLTQNVIMDNAAPNGGAIWFQGQTTTMSRCVVTGNHSTNAGAGAIYIGSYPVNLAGNPTSGAYNIIACNDATYEIYNDVPFNPNGSNDIHAEYVRWCTNDPQDMLACIYDFFDNATKSMVVWSPAVAHVPGDMNCDGVVDFGDINPFVLALTNSAAYAAEFPDCLILNADINGDCMIDFGDINPFVALFTGQ